MSVISVVKEHPYLIGGGAIAVIVIVFVLSGPKSASVTTSSRGGEDGATAAANAQIVSAQLAYQARGNDLTAQLEAANIAATTAVRLKEIEAGAQYEEDSLAATVAHESLAMQGAVALGQQETQRFITDSQQTTQRFGIAQEQQTNRDIARMQTEEHKYEMLTMANMTASHDAAMTDIAMGQQETARYTIGQQAAVALGQLETQRFISAQQSAEHVVEMQTLRDMTETHEAAIVQQNHDNLEVLQTVQELHEETANHQIDANMVVALDSHDVMIHALDTQAAESAAARAAAEAAAQARRDQDAQNQVWRNNAAIVAAQGNMAGAQWFLAQQR